MKILLVDDDEGLLSLLSVAIQRAGFQPITAADGSSALRLLTEQQPDLLVLDIKLGSDDGLQVLESIRRSCDVPVIVLSTLDSEDDVERALRLGADDYMTKPLSFRELVARIRGVLRRTSESLPEQPSDPKIRAGALALNTRDHTATLDGIPLSLTPTEYRLLQVLMENAGRVVEYRVLLKRVWGYDDPNAIALVRTAVFRLRRKFILAEDQVTIRTVPGVGVALQYRDEHAPPALPNDSLAGQANGDPQVLAPA